MRVADVLGVHVNSMTSPAKAMILAVLPGVLKVLNTGIDVPTIQAWRAARPDGILIARSVQNDLSGTPAQRSATLQQQFSSINSYIDVYECPWNEAYQDDGSLAMYAGLTNQAVQIIESWGKSAGIGMFSCGNPVDIAGFKSLYLANIAPSSRQKYLCLHEYSAPTMQSGTNCGRFVQLGSPYPVLITECGIDGGVIGKDDEGYTSFGGDTVYAPQLTTYAGVLAANKAKGTIFCCGQFGDWSGFDVAGNATIQNALEATMATPTTPATYSVGPGVAAKLAQESDTPTSDEQYLGSELSFTTGKKGLYVYSKGANMTNFLPWAS